VRDFADVASAFAPIHEALDHRYLNEIEGLDNPTSEVLAAWIWDRLEPALPELASITIRETCRSGAVLRAEDRG
jgi:6-pyruvoyltetrahydropterin/6-carboxytetrahydropterin synthase